MARATAPPGSQTSYSNTSVRIESLGNLDDRLERGTTRLRGALDGREARRAIDPERRAAVLGGVRRQQHHVVLRIAAALDVRGAHALHEVAVLARADLLDGAARLGLEVGRDLDEAVDRQAVQLRGLAHGRFARRVVDAIGLRLRAVHV